MAFTVVDSFSKSGVGADWPHLPFRIDHAFSPKVLQGKRYVTHIEDSPIPDQRLSVASSVPPIWRILSC